MSCRVVSCVHAVSHHAQSVDVMHPHDLLLLPPLPADPFFVSSVAPDPPSIHHRRPSHPPTATRVLLLLLLLLRPFATCLLSIARADACLGPEKSRETAVTELVYCALRCSLPRASTAVPSPRQPPWPWAIQRPHSFMIRCPAAAARTHTLPSLTPPLVRSPPNHRPCRDGTPVHA